MNKIKSLIAILVKLNLKQILKILMTIKARKRTFKTIHIVIVKLIHKIRLKSMNQIIKSL